jgi:hypothetical protein
MSTRPDTSAHRDLPPYAGATWTRGLRTRHAAGRARAHPDELEPTVQVAARALDAFLLGIHAGIYLVDAAWRSWTRIHSIGFTARPRPPCRFPPLQRTAAPDTPAPSWSPSSAPSSDAWRTGHRSPGRSADGASRRRLHDRPHVGLPADATRLAGVVGTGRPAGLPADTDSPGGLRRRGRGDPACAAAGGAGRRVVGGHLFDARTGEDATPPAPLTPGGVGLRKGRNGVWIAPARMRAAAERAIAELALTAYCAVFVGQYVAGRDLTDLLRSS